MAAAASALPLLAGVAPLAGCAANFDSQLLQPYNQAVGINERDGGVLALDVAVVADESGNGTLVGALVNKTADIDQLLTVNAGGRVTAPDLAEPITLDPETLVQLAELPNTVSISGPDVQPGMTVPLTLQFTNAQPIEAQVPVVAQEGTYAEISIEPAEG